MKYLCIINFYFYTAQIIDDICKTTKSYSDKVCDIKVEISIEHVYSLLRSAISICCITLTITLVILLVKICITIY